MRRVKWACAGIVAALGALCGALGGSSRYGGEPAGQFHHQSILRPELASTAVKFITSSCSGNYRPCASCIWRIRRRRRHLAGGTRCLRRQARAGLRRGPRLASRWGLVPLRATHWTSSLPTEQGGFSLRVDVDFAGRGCRRGHGRTLEFTNQNYAGRMGWHEIVVKPEPGVQVFDTDAYSTSLTGGSERSAAVSFPRLVRSMSEPCT
jgi:hypothetical protein